MKKLEIIILSTVILLAFSVRLYKINRPVADWHSWRQADTAAVARNFIKEGFNPLTPKYDDMSSQANGLNNPNRFRFVEFPIYNSLIYLVWTITGVNDTFARLVTVFISLGSTVLLFLIVMYLSGFATAILAAFFFAFLPYNVFYSSAILPGPLMVFGILGLYLSFLKWIDNDRNWLWGILTVLFANLAILTWPIAIFFLIPVLYLAHERYGLGLFKRFNLWIFAFFSIAPFIAWRLWVSHFPEGIPNWQFLLNEGNIRFKGAFFRWIIAERIGKLILTVCGFSLLILGLLTRLQNKERLFYFAWLLAVAFYFTVMASGNVRHDYYQVPFVPIAAVFMAKGTLLLWKLPKVYFSRYLGPVVSLVLILLIFAFGYFEIRGYYWINKPQIVAAGKAVDRLLPRNATVIAPYNGDAAFLYQTNRHGYPIVDRPLEKFIEEDTKYLVSVDVTDSGIKNLTTFCKVIEKTDDYVIIEMFTGCIGKQS